MSARFTSLADLVCCGRDPSSAVAFARANGTEEIATFGDLTRSVARAADELARAGVASGARVALFEEDPFAFAAGLLASWQCGCVVVLPPNSLPGSRDRLRARVAATLGAAELAIDGVLHVALSREPGDVATRALVPLDREMPALELHTSGTTGDATVASKRLRHLDDEVAVLERTFGAAVASARIYATASHQHLYGLLFRVLWPLAAGRPFSRERLLHKEELLPRLADERRSALASVPAHLARLESALGAARFGAIDCVVFSSGGPLEASTAHAFEAALGDAPIEVFGSTETGGVAHRRQRARAPGGATPWTPFEGVELEIEDEDQRLVVRSPAVSEGGAAGFRMGDRARRSLDGRFELLGRADRVIKIGAKRLALPEMEERLRAHPAVAKAALVGIEQAGQERVGAVVVASEEGARRIAGGERAALGRELADHLARDFDRVLVPRVFRYVEALPEDAQGKSTSALLRALFDAPPAAPEPVALRPKLVREERGSDAAMVWLERTFEVDASLASLDGHFPGEPIVPGVAELALADEAARALLGDGEELAIERVEALKFASPLAPPARVVLRVERRVDPSPRASDLPARVAFRLLDASDDAPREFASGRLYLARAPELASARWPAIRPCLLIPIFDHGAEVGAVLESLAGYGLPCLVIDDGSGKATRERLDALAAELPWVRLFRRARNGGRGAALRDGYALAGRLGFTHALQLDADGQHDAADVPRMLDAANADPEALVLGRPIFDASAPKSRLYGRKVSQFFVWLETLSFAIRDPLCGFRCFPLAPTLELLDLQPLGDRMDFDPEIAVRLVWRGLRVVNVPTHVVYRAGGLSHFEPVADTLRIARAHSRLVFGMVPRAPWLLARAIWRAFASRESGGER